MKKIISLALITVSIAATAATDPASKVSFTVLNHFTDKFLKAENVDWKVTDQFVKASFILNGKEMNAFYDNYGELTAVTAKLQFDKLPQRAIMAIGLKYPFPLYKLTDCIEMQTPNGKTNYYVSLLTDRENIVLEISPNGNVSEFKRLSL
ncbi:MAG: hypothetical protein K2W79_00255 [Hydrotalea flava]|uniref:hypothetical protein n=1 Tax=unclassified Hydrotalea TaxID=2643788 RepID=UPI00094257AC|nr:MULTISPECIES: hypothetical protein [unclassified Hydrotalea]MBY0346663.1 hypothetical protein [Hydrotalea flava]RWZ86166.1 MAG: hypothetical protein EO766_15155 [Hydrotalea sp. AMD]